MPKGLHVRKSLRSSLSEFSLLCCSERNVRRVGKHWYASWAAIKNDRVLTLLCVKSATVCSAASDYLGPCPRHAQLGRFTPQLKVNFEIVCFTSWPGQVDCVRDYSTACPLGWTKLEKYVSLPKRFSQQRYIFCSGICSAPAEYFGNRF